MDRLQLGAPTERRAAEVPLQAVRPSVLPVHCLGNKTNLRTSPIGGAWILAVLPIAYGSSLFAP
jgi:hypothetical protein